MHKTHLRTFLNTLILHTMPGQAFIPPVEEVYEENKASSDDGSTTKKITMEDLLGGKGKKVKVQCGGRAEVLPKNQENFGERKRIKP